MLRIVLGNATHQFVHSSYNKSLLKITQECLKFVGIS